MEIALSVALGIVIAVLFLAYLPQIIEFSLFVIPAIALIIAFIIGAIWLYEIKPEVIWLLMIMVAVAGLSVLFSSFKERIYLYLKNQQPTMNLEFFASTEEKEKDRRKSLGYDK
jgi:hypothetical protein